LKRFIAPVFAGLLCALAVLPAGASQPELVFVLNSRDASVSLIDKAKRAEISRLTVGKEPHHLYPTPDGRSLIIGNAMSDDLIYVDPVSAAIQRRVAAVDDPYQIGFSPDRRWFGVAALRLDRVDLYQHDNGELKLAKRLTLPKAPSHLWFSADSSMVFVTLQDSGEIAAIALPSMEVAWKMKTGSQPAGIVVTRDDRYLLVGVMGENYVDVIDWRERKRVKRIVTGKGAHNLRGAGDGRHVFVTNRVANSISRIDLQTLSVVDTISVPGGPDCMELTADGRFLWVTQRFARQVAVIDLNERRIVDTIAVGRSPHGIFFRNRAPLM
jgi:YVTN family beta-propeller protein